METPSGVVTIHGQTERYLMEKWTPTLPPVDIATSNPVALLNQTDDRSKVYRSIGNLNLDYKFHFLPDLSAKLNLGYDYYDSKGHRYQPENAAFTVRGGTGFNDNY